MARSDLTVRATTSTAIQFQLLAGIVPINLTAVDGVELWLEDRAGGTVAYLSGDGKLAINGAAGGSVSLTPGTADLVAGSSPYNYYFKVRVTPTTWYFVPEDSENTVNVRPTF